METKSGSLLVGMPPPQREWISIEHSTSGDNDGNVHV